MKSRMRAAVLPPLPTLVCLTSGYTESQLIQYADKVRALALLEASNACMSRITQRMRASKMNGHSLYDAEALACSRTIHQLLDPIQAEVEGQLDLLAELDSKEVQAAGEAVSA